MDKRCPVDKTGKFVRYEVNDNYFESSKMVSKTKKEANIINLFNSGMKTIDIINNTGEDFRYVYRIISDFKKGKKWTLTDCVN